MEISVKSEECFLCFLTNVPRQWPASGSRRGSRQGGRGSEPPRSSVWSPQPREGAGCSVSALLSRPLGWTVAGPLKGDRGGWFGETQLGAVSGPFPQLCPGDTWPVGGPSVPSRACGNLTKRPALATCFIPTKRRRGPFTSSLTPGSAPSPPHLTSEEGLCSFPTWSWGPSQAGSPLGSGACHLPMSLVDRAQVIWARTQHLVHWQGGLERLTHQ